MKVITLGFFIASLCGYLTADGGDMQMFNSDCALGTFTNILGTATPLALMLHDIQKAFPDIYTGAKNLTEQAKTCIGNLKNDNKTGCSQLEDINYRCAVDLKEYYERTLPKSAETIPRLVRDSYINSVGHICKLQVKTFWELLDNCIETVHYDFINVLVKNQSDVRPTMKAVIKDHQTFLIEPTRARLCRIMESARNHTKQHLSTFCSDKFVVQAALDLFDVAVAPCKHEDSL